MKMYEQIDMKKDSTSRCDGDDEKKMLLNRESILSNGLRIDQITDFQDFFKLKTAEEIE